MSAALPLIVTDLDGTLLDHDSYSYAAAAAALETIRERRWPLLLSSSKTRAEIVELRNRLENSHPFVVENGAAVYVPGGYFSEPAGEPEGDFEIQRFGAGRDRILDEIRRVRAQAGLRFEGFADWSVREIAERTGLSEAAAARAGDRCCSEPVLFEDDPEKLNWFRTELEQAGLRAVQGGRFLHVMGRFDKADGLSWLRERYQSAFPERKLVVIALGDSPNDAGMLEAADVAVIVQSARSDELNVSAPRRVIRTSERGPAGWQQAMNELLPEFM